MLHLTDGVQYAIMCDFSRYI